MGREVGKEDAKMGALVAAINDSFKAPIQREMKLSESFEATI